MILEFGTGADATQVYENLDFQVTGSIPTEEGNHWLTVKSRQGYVVIGFTLLDINPPGFSETLVLLFSLASPHAIDVGFVPPCGPSY